MIDFCQIRKERKKKGFSARIILDLPEFISSGRGKSPPAPLCTLLLFLCYYNLAVRIENLIENVLR